ncbi:MAG: SIMPL domain-containing protein [Bryobacteraceae bacterium]|nr:SIMPL domain-containing protein [Bryobacteraceae bacterium]
MRYLWSTMLLAALTLGAQTPPSDANFWRQPTVRAQGSATATAKPDQVRIDIGVVTQAATAQQAGADNARQFTAVVTELKKVLGAKGEIQTVSYGISPNYRYPKEGGTPTITGYTATNNVRVTSPDVDASGKIIDAASRVGANAIRGIEFSLRNEQALRAVALTEATRQARANADAMASGAGMKIVRILRIEENTQGEGRQFAERGVMMMKAQAADSMPTPVEAGNIRVEVNVVLTGELGS